MTRPPLPDDLKGYHTRRYLFDKFCWEDERMNEADKNEAMHTQGHSQPVTWKPDGKPEKVDAEHESNVETLESIAALTAENARLREAIIEAEEWLVATEGIGLTYSIPASDDSSGEARKTIESVLAERAAQGDSDASRRFTLRD